MALTFDDGPNEPYTSQILAILNRYHVKATFFMVGKNVEAFPEAAKAVAEAGHAIGNHSYTHPVLVLKTNAHVRSEITLAQDAIEKATGHKLRLFRPPFGFYDPLTLSQAEKLGYISIKWSVSSKDWKRPGVKKIVSNVMGSVHNGGIILMHDGFMTHHGGDRSQTVGALPQIIRELQEQGYELVTVPELLNLKAEP